MKRAAIFLLFSVLVFSCKKETNISIIGNWIEDANYHMDSTGQYTWGPASRWPANLSFTTNGTCEFFQEMAGGTSAYRYNPSTKELLYGGSNAPAYKVSLLNEQFLILDSHYPGEKIRYRRL
jgi:hypothetical protein